MKALIKLAVLSMSLGICIGIFATENVNKVTYKWTDAEGIVQYTERPPKDMAYEKITVSTSGAQETTNVTQEQAVEEAESKTNTALDGIIESNKRNCKIAKENLEVLTKLARIRVKGEDGEERILSPEEKQKKLSETQKQVDVFCTN